MRALYHHQFGAVKTFSSRTLRFVALVIAGLFILSQFALSILPAKASTLDPFPSTNEDNKNQQAPRRVGQPAPYVDLLSSTTNSITVKFFNPTGTDKWFEYRIDDAPPTGTSKHGPCRIGVDPLPSGCGGLRYLAEDDYSYPSKKVNAGSTLEQTFTSVGDNVAFRMTFGPERDWDFDWTAFNVLKPPAKPANFFFTKNANDTNTATTCGASINWALQTTAQNDEFAAWAHWDDAPHTKYHIETFFKDGSTWDRLHNSNNSKPMPYRFYGLGSEGDGLYRIKVVAYDTQSGLHSDPANCNLSYDTTRPTIVLEPGIEGSFNPTSYSATATDNIELDVVTAHLRRNGSNTLVKNCSQSNVGGTSYTLNCVVPAGLADGVYNIRYNARDAAGNLSITHTAEFTIDNTPPSVPSNLHRVLPATSEVLPCGILTQRQTLYPTWDANTESDFSHYEYTSINADGNIGINEQVMTSNQFVHNWVPPVDGTNGFKVRSVDNTGNKSAWSDVCEVTYDSTKPSIPQIIFPNDGDYFTNSPILNDWTEATDVNGIDYYQIAYNYDDGHTFGGSTCPGLTISGLTGFIGCRNLSATQRNHSPNTSEQGGVTILVRAFDNAGNASDWSTSVHYIYDSVPPAKVEGLKFVDDDGDVTDGNTNDYSVSAHWDTISDANKYEYCYWNDIATSTYNEGNCYTTFPTTNSQSGVFNQGEGMHHIKVRAIDAAGNEGPWSDTLDIIYDATPPTTVNPLSSPNNDTAWNGAIPIAGETTDDNGVNFIDIYAKPAGSDDSNYQHVTTVDNSSDNSPFGWTFDWTPSAEGAYDIKAAGTDVAGNVESSGYALAIVFDQTAPAVAIDPITTGDTQVDGTVDNDAVSVEVSFDNGTTWSPATYTLGDTTWTAPIPALSSGAHTVLARATDAASNVTTPPAEENFEIGESGNVLACVIMQDQTVVCDDDNSSASQDNQRVLGDTDGEVLAATGQGGWLMTTLGSVIMGLALATRLSRKKA